MATELSLGIALLVGLFGSAHCLGMCGGIVGALTFSLPQEVRERRSTLVSHLLAYNLGRLLSYAIAGALAAGFGAALLAVGGGTLRIAVQWFAALVLLLIGLHIAGWLPQAARIEHLGTPLWRHLEPLGRRLLPVRSPLHAAAFGAVWGWLPCGLVYSVLLWCMSLGNPLYGALTMLAFGAGTLPAMVGTGILAGWAARISGSQPLRRVAGIAVILAAAATLWLGSHAMGH